MICSLDMVFQFKSPPSDLCFKWPENYCFCTALHASCGSDKKYKLQTIGIIFCQQALFTVPSEQWASRALVPLA